jgi:ribonucleoside-diphosphate reductase alpha chain
MNVYQQFIHKSRYARYLPEQKRRETWAETVDRYFEFLKWRYHQAGRPIPWGVMREAVYNLDVMPSMRAMMTAGKALERDNVAGYNCAYTAIDNQRAFDEIMYILLCGTGVGFSVERQYINQLPEVAEEFIDVDTTITVPDSKMGWASSLRQLIGLLYQGQVPRWNLSRLRPAGAPLKTFGGRASGPEPLDELFRWTVAHFKRAAGRKLNSLEVHDQVCKVAGAVVVGGVRRAALISLSNLTDERMRHAKAGEWYHIDPHRGIANNSVAYTERPDMSVFMREWFALYASKSGERGMFSRYSLRLPERRDPDHQFGTNPCSEIILRPKQFCNLTEIVVRPEDDERDIKRKIKYATILGTLQAGLTNFRYLSKQWKENCEEEALLGLSMTGVYDHPLLAQADSIPEVEWYAEQWRDYSVKVNQQYAAAIGVRPAAAITCIKPSGTVSQLVDSSSGIHPRYAPYYIRRVRGDKTDPLCQRLIDSGIYHESDLKNPNTWVFDFPMKSPPGSVHIKDVSAISQLEHWLWFDKHWCEHKPSVSIYVREHEWMEVGAWVYEHLDDLSGVSFFPLDDSVYAQKPYEEITEERYTELMDKFPRTIDFDIEEDGDWTTGSQELACSAAGGCEI